MSRGNWANLSDPFWRISRLARVDILKRDVGRRLINAGPFRGFSAIIEALPEKLQRQIDSGVLSELDESMCATIAIDIFGRLTSSTIQLRSLEKL